MEENNNNTALEKVPPDNGSYYEKKYDYYECFVKVYNKQTSKEKHEDNMQKTK